MYLPRPGESNIGECGAMLSNETALVLLSGGQDSTTCLAWALENFRLVETVGFQYGQRHVIELSCRERVRDKIRHVNMAWDQRLGEDRVLDASILSSLSTTALTSSAAISVNPDGLPTTFVPGRNIFFLILAAVVAHQRNIRHIVSGVCETDYSGYPDCRDDTIKAIQLALNGAMDRRFVLDTPLMWVDKAETFSLAQSLGGDPLIELILEETHTCYLGDREHRHDWGYGCDDCPACELRKAGYLKWKGAKA
jgi:7-cyano-7-deazaguanine synthase